ncbi:tellurite resistance TerB C-terminal domain-containing protein [Emticicia sp. SJ17W-69]|uniref:tellurite resistance TerB C-terminal domain-containing protein n=1 Tax=Emticicia sp. SJ17W-69 TaxID=3421657 RepID=UPI003EB7490E
MNSLNSFSAADTSIIDITSNNAEDIPTDDLYISVEIPFWKPNRKSRNIRFENSKQALFFENFKNSFYANEFYDLRGYTNYALFLINNIDEDFMGNNNFSLFQERIGNLIHYYPQIKTQAQLCLKEAIFYKRDSISLSIFLKECPKDNTHRLYSTETEKLGNQFKKKFDLSSNETSLLNELNYNNSLFFNIYFYREEIVKVFIHLLRQLEKHFSDSFDKISKRFANEFKVDKTEIYKWILIQCENTIALIYGFEKEIHLNTLYIYRQGPILKFENEIIQLAKQLIAEYMVFYVPTNEDEKTLESIYTISKTKGKSHLKYLVDKYTTLEGDFLFEVVALTYFNRNNFFYFNIFFDIFKEIANRNNIIALKIYLHYIYHQLSFNIPTKLIPVNIKAKLFPQKNQELHFEKIVRMLLLEKDLPKALSEITKIYEVKRKKILLDKISIRAVEESYTGTVELLNEYLRDDENNDSTILSETEKVDEKNTENKTNNYSVVSKSSPLQGIQVVTLELFVKNNLTVAKNEMKVFANVNGVFVNHLIESINDSYYEFLDDLLIEEDEENYVIYLENFQKISAS